MEVYDWDRDGRSVCLCSHRSIFSPKHLLSVFLPFHRCFFAFICRSHDFIGDYTTSYRELARGQSQFNVYEVSVLPDTICGSVVPEITVAPFY